MCILVSILINFILLVFDISFSDLKLSFQQFYLKIKGYFNILFRPVWIKPFVTFPFLHNGYCPQTNNYFPRLPHISCYLPNIGLKTYNWINIFMKFRILRNNLPLALKITFAFFIFILSILISIMAISWYFNWINYINLLALLLGFSDRAFP